MAAEKRSNGPLESEGTVPEGEALFGALFESSAMGIAIFSIGGRFLRANPAFCRMVGYTEPELQLKTHLDIVHLDDLEGAALSRVQAISGKSKPRLIERRYIHKDGSTVWAHIAGCVVRDPAGSPVCTLAIMSEVSSLKRALRSSEQRFRRMVEMSSDWYWVQDEQFRFVDVPGLDVSALDTDVVAGKARWEIPNLGALPEKAWQQHRARLERHESFSDFVFLRYNRAGELRYLSVSGEPLFDEQGKFKGYHGVGKDITERAHDQKALEQSESRYRMLFEVHPQPMWVVDASSLAFLAVNSAAVALYGYGKQEFLSMTADQIRPEEDIASLLKAFEDQSRNYRQRVWRHRKKNGDLVQVKVISFNLEFDGRPARLGVIYDLTDQINTERRAQELEDKYRALMKEREGGS